MIRKLESLKNPIRIGLVGAGCMGKGIAYQISITPGMRLEWIADKCPLRAQQLATSHAATHGTDTHRLLRESPVDVFVEATNSLWSAYQYCEAALENGAHIVLMNAEVDLAFGPILCKLAAEKNLIVTSDAGDQHGVLATMIQEIKLWGFQIVQAGNIKGFLNRYAVATELLHEAAIRNLSPNQCCAYTDGTKLNIEMAILANAFHLLPTQPGMQGPAIRNVEQVLDVFEFPTDARSDGSVDYILGSKPNGGVYVIGKCDSLSQQAYLNYYKLGSGPYYLFRRDYHLCHLETTTAIAKLFFYHEPILQPWAGRVADVYAFAKSAIPADTEIPLGIGGDHFYGLIAPTALGRENGWVPIALLDAETHHAATQSQLAKDQALTWRHLHPFTPPMVELFYHPANSNPV